MNVMGLTEEEQSNILQVVAGVLHLGNVMFREKGNYSEIEDENGKFIYSMCIITEWRGAYRVLVGKPE
jgi:myosin heavy subunit